MSVNKEALKYYTSSLLEYTQPYVFNDVYNTSIYLCGGARDGWSDEECYKFIDFCNRANNDGNFKAPLILTNALIKKPQTTRVEISATSNDDCASSIYDWLYANITINFPVVESSGAVKSNYICYRVNSTSPAEYVAIGLSNNLSQTEYLNLKSTLDSLHNGGIS